MQVTAVGQGVLVPAMAVAAAAGKSGAPVETVADMPTRMEGITFRAIGKI